MAGRFRHHGLMRTTGRALAALVLVVGAAACTDDGEEPPPADRTDHVALELSIGPGAGDLSTQARDELQNDVGAVLTSYVVDAFLGDYPRDDFVQALDAFTSGVVDQAAADLNLVTGAGFGKGVQGVTATRLSATISSFVPKSDVVGVTALVDLAFDVEAADGTTSELIRRGRLMLMPDDGEWKIFGYDLTPRPEGAS